MEEASSSVGMKVAKEQFKVLIVDDQLMIRMIHSNFLRKHETLITEAENGRQSVDLCKSGAVFDLILMDKQMPIMDGVEATRNLRASGVTSMIVGVTTSSKEEIKEFMEAGLDFCFEKPLKDEKITFLIEKLKLKKGIN